MRKERMNLLLNPSFISKVSPWLVGCCRICVLRSVQSLVSHSELSFLRKKNSVRLLLHTKDPGQCQLDD